MYAVIRHTFDMDTEDKYRSIGEWKHVVWVFKEETDAMTFAISLLDHPLLMANEHYLSHAIETLQEGKYWQVGSAAWERRADSAFNEMTKRGYSPWVHMLRGLAMAGDKYPFASADSANVARHHNEMNMCPERMARRIDAVQCPSFWTLRYEQEELFND